MPGPGVKNKSKTKPKSKKIAGPGTSTSSDASRPRDAFVDDIDNADGWASAVAILCNIFELPDLTTRSGLKKIHKNFTEIYKRLDDAYTRNINNDRIAGGIVGIYSKMSADSILRNRLFSEDFLSKIFPLLDRPSCCRVVLRALCNVTHSGGRDVRIAIARKASTLTRLLEEQPNDPIISELSMVVLSHAARSAITDDQPPDAKLRRVLDIPNLLRLTITLLKKPTASTLLADHALSFLSGATLHFSSEMFAYQPSVDFLVANLRSSDIANRCTALSGLLRLGQSRAEPDHMNLDPQAQIAAIRRGFPPHLSEVLMMHGPERVDTYIILRGQTEYQKAMMRVAQDHDLANLGLTLTRLIVRTEYSVAEGMFQSQNPRTGKMETIDVGLPFKMWIDALPMCADAVRAKYPDDADILDCKYLVMKARQPEAGIIADCAIKRNPHVGFFYYILSLCADHTLGLRMAKKGLKCPNLTGYVRFGLMYRAAEHAGLMGLDVLQEAEGGRHKWDEGIAFVTSALEDAKTYINEASPDTRNMKTALYWYNLFSLIVKGSEISADLQELEDSLQKLKTADELTVFLTSKKPAKTVFRLTHQVVIERMAAAAKEWDEIVARCAITAPRQALPTDQAEDHLAAWLDEMHLDDHTDDGPECTTHPKINTNKVELYKCSWCSNPSAILKKCSLCGRARYCDSSCQKSHWNEHKHACKAV
ncbi:hypothetical protein BD410DRAFT_751998 [Rickenella mellea]|uniref:MYND-type domain-containing protein n=1 Tax=Rickenella mellea TaxID=50990 RepID=A0A4Y7PX20_9AGAM|nr:hypothetical protein BD410DRAFT_751998 [Rickenella mellea]